MGYNFKMTAFHIGAPVTYESPDGGTITVYDGKRDANMGEDQRKIIYKKEIWYKRCTMMIMEN